MIPLSHIVPLGGLACNTLIYISTMLPSFCSKFSVRTPCLPVYMHPRSKGLPVCLTAFIQRNSINYLHFAAVLQLKWTMLRYMCFLLAHFNCSCIIRRPAGSMAPCCIHVSRDTGTNNRVQTGDLQSWSGISASGNLEVGKLCVACHRLLMDAELPRGVKHKS